MMQMTRPLKSECSCLDYISSFWEEMETTVPIDLAFEDRMQLPRCISSFCGETETTAPSDLDSEVRVQMPGDCIPSFCEQMKTTTPSDLASEVRVQLPRLSSKFLWRKGNNHPKIPGL